MTTLPSETITLLFSDMPGSTTLPEQHTEATSAMAGCYDPILRDAIAAHKRSLKPAVMQYVLPSGTPLMR
jgi:class 3 adenylate cyclase